MAERLPGADAPVMREGDFAYIDSSGLMSASTDFNSELFYEARSVGRATQDIYTYDIDAIYPMLRMIKSDHTVYQDRYEEATGAEPNSGIRIEGDFELNQVSMVSDPIDPQVTFTMEDVQPVQPMVGYVTQNGVRPPDEQDPIGRLTTRRPTVNTHTHENDQLAAALNLVKAQEEGIVERLKRQAHKDSSGQFQVCYGCLYNTDSVFPGKGDSQQASCIPCMRFTGNKHHKDLYMTKDSKETLYQLFAEEVVPVIKKQAMFEAKQRISEAEEKDNKVKRTMVRIAKKRA